MMSHPDAEAARIASESAEAMRRYQEAKQGGKTSPGALSRLWDEVCYWAEREMDGKRDRI